MIRLYDTAQRDKVPFEPLQAPKVGIYVCGPTVYDKCHVGHARVYVAFDVIVRYLRHKGYQVTYVRNLTDVDDKIIQRAAEIGEDPLRLSASFASEFHDDMAALGNQAPDVEPKVSEHIAEIIQLIEKIIDNGYAYQIGGDVYFEVKRFSPYGALSRRNLEDLQAGARVDVNEQKHNPLDFALWKSAKPGEPSWDSPWGKGRPGWHIECSAMSSRYLSPAFDIHGGGMDLIFPHHENEIAQSRSVFGPESFARYWMHNGFINVKTGENTEEKMSKSLGNFFTIQEVCARHEPEALRLFLLGTHYRKPLTFEVDAGTDGHAHYTSLDDAELRLSYAYSTIARLDQALASGKPATTGEILAPAHDFITRFDQALEDDFNTAAALGLSSELFSLTNKLLDQPKSAPKDARRRTLQTIREAVDHIHQVCGIYGQNPLTYLERRRDRLCSVRGIEKTAVEELIEKRTQARKSKDFATADTLRGDLEAMGVEVMDGPTGTTWRVPETESTR